MNRCVGVGNHRSFFGVIISMLIAAAIHANFAFIYVFGVAGGIMVSKFEFFLMCHSIMIVLGCAGLLMGQSYTVALALTTNEAMNRWRYAYLSQNNGASPFDEGKVKNCLTFWGFKTGKSFVRQNRAQFAFGSKAINLSNSGDATRGLSAPSADDQVVIDMQTIRDANGGGHGHSHGGQACHGHGGASQHHDVPDLLPSPPAPSGSLHLQSLLKSHQQSDAAMMDLDPECAYFHGSDESHSHHPVSHSHEQQASVDRDPEHRLEANETNEETTGLISGMLNASKDKHH